MIALINKIIYSLITTILVVSIFNPYTFQGTDSILGKNLVLNTSGNITPFGFGMHTVLFFVVIFLIMLVSTKD